jgi:hypothetical protein
MIPTSSLSVPLNYNLSAKRKKTNRLRNPEKSDPHKRVVKSAILSPFRIRRLLRFFAESAVIYRDFHHFMINFRIQTIFAINPTQAGLRFPAFNRET